tara:strand:+ start:201 stop:2228 length:2028 start_codon:yes stop_codon:yes gene_type:complete
MSGYCSSRFATVRRPSREVFVGNVGVGGENPIRIQSMTTTNTQDVSATVAQSITLAEAGCEIIRITAPNKKAAQALKEIHRKFRNAGFNNPLVADIHFLPSAAMEAVEHVEKVRVNPGNYADNKKFAIREYSDSQYLDELERLHEEFSPLVMRAKELGRSMRVGCNHGSLSDRIMNRYGDTPLGMVESVLEFLRIAEKHSYQDIILSMKSSNPKVMIEAYRLLVEKMDAEGMSYPLHLGVTEAGDGEDGRIKSAIGIGSLLMDGLGDTIRVSLTEDPIYEIPVAEALARKAMKQWAVRSQPDDKPDSIDPYSFSRRVTNPVELAPNIRVNSETPPSVITRSATPITKPQELSGELKQTSLILSDTPIESLWIRLDSPEDFETIPEASRAVSSFVSSLTLEIAPEIDLQSLSKGLPKNSLPLALLRDFGDEDYSQYIRFLRICSDFNAIPIAGLGPDCEDGIFSEPASNLIVTLRTGLLLKPPFHETGVYRRLAEKLRNWRNTSPIWIRNGRIPSRQQTGFLDRLLDASLLTGSLLCDGIGDLVSIESEPNLARATKLAYNLLQGAGSRISKTEFVACPSCGRTLFDLQTTTQRIREKTGHLKGVKIAIMGCIVNGPGEMADADFGYVGGAPSKINLYVGKECVRYNIPEDEADDRLIDLIKEHGKWVDPENVSFS